MNQLIIYKETNGVFSSFDSNLGITRKVFKQLMTKKTPNSTKSYGAYHKLWRWHLTGYIGCISFLL